MLVLLFGCGAYPRNPSCDGRAPKSRCCFWAGPKERVTYWYQNCNPRCQEAQQPDPDQQLSLPDIIDFALCNNPDTRATWSVARAAAYNLGAEESALYPSLAVNERIGLTKQFQGAGLPLSSARSRIGSTADRSSDKKDRYFQTLASDLLFTYLVLDFGGRSGKIEAARQALYRADWLHNREVQRVISGVLQAYYNYTDALSQYEAQIKDLEDAKATLDSAVAMQQAGVKTIADVLQSKSQYVERQLDLEKASRNIHATEGKLAREMGLPADAVITVEGMPDELPIETTVGSVEELMTIAKRCRPDLAAAQAQVLQAEAEFAVAKSDALPQFTQNAEIEKDAYFHDSNLNSHILSTSLYLTMPLFDGFYYRNRIRQARENIRLSMAEYQSREYDILLDVLVAYYDFTTAIESIKYSQSLIEYATENYDVARANYRHGTGTIIDLLTAQATLANARAQLIDSRTKWANSLVNIAYTTGTLGCK